MTYPGTKGETLDTDKAVPSGLPRQLSTLPRHSLVITWVGVPALFRRADLADE